jgi:hypothetical protein
LKRIIFSGISLFLCTITHVLGQSCGVSIADQLAMSAKFDQKIDHDIYHQIHDRGAVAYIPVKFHLVGQDDGKGKVKYNSVLDQLTRLNQDFIKSNIQFYLKDGYKFSEINSDLLYDNARDNEQQLVSKKDASALNIFVVNKIGSSQSGNSGEVLGYYSPSSDIVVMKADDILGNTNTISHEVGHFFNLRHTFFGWEATPYDEQLHGNPCNISVAPSYGVQVEFADKSNCNVAADQLCDTPPDYNFGIATDRCVFNKIILDFNSDTIKPMKNNQMSYFSNCTDFAFTDGQNERMQKNYSTSARNSIKSSYLPNVNTLALTSKLISPVAGVKIPTYNNVKFVWEDQGADFYLIEIQGGSEFYQFFVDKVNTFTATNLQANKFYVWSVRSFHDGNSATLAPTSPFRTGDQVLGVTDLSSVEKFSVYGNPVYQGQPLYVELDTKSTGKYQFTIFDMQGKVVVQRVEQLSQGGNVLNFNSDILAKGMYSMRVSNSDGSLALKFAVL